MSDDFEIFGADEAKELQKSDILPAGEYPVTITRAEVRTKDDKKWLSLGCQIDLIGFIEIDLMVGDDGKPIIKKDGNEVRRTITVTPRGGLTAKSRIPGVTGTMTVDSFVSKVNEIFSKKGK